MLEVLYHRAKFGAARTSCATRGHKIVEFFVCLSVTLLNDVVRYETLSRRRWTVETVLTSLDRRSTRLVC